MCRWFAFVIVMGLLAAMPAMSPAQELLTNPDIEFPADTYWGAIPAGWQMSEGPLVPETPGPYPADYDESGVTAPCTADGFCNAVNAGDYPVWRNHLGETFQLPNEVPNITAGRVTEADYIQWKWYWGYPHTVSMAEPSFFNILDPDNRWNMWFQPYNSTRTENAEAIANNWAHLYQDVPGTSGVQYTMTGWALFENLFPGAHTNLNATNLDGTPTGAPFNDGPLSPTDTFFALEFLDANGVVLPGSITDYELKAHGQPTNPIPGGDPIWMQHTLVATAPVGTVEVRVRASMINGVENPLPCPECYEQSFFVDKFSLTVTGPGSGGLGVVPEPGAGLLTAIALGAWIAAGRRHTSHRQLGST